MTDVREPHPRRHRAEAARYGKMMLRRFGWFHWLLGLRRPLSRMRLDDASAERIRTASQQGPIVYVMLRASSLDHLAVNRVLNDRRLPLSIWVNDISVFFWQPVIEAWTGLFQRTWDRLRSAAPPDPLTSGWAMSALEHGEAISIFLEPQRSLWRKMISQRSADALPALIEAQRRFDRPIQLLPVLVVWQRGPARPVHPALRLILADPERPSGLRRLWKLAWHAKDNFVQVGEPVELTTFLARVPERKHQRRTLYVMLRRYLRREGLVIRGPRLPGPASMRAMVLDNPPMRRLCEEEAARSGSSHDRVRKKMEREYDLIAARMRWWVIRLADLGMRQMFTRVYSGVDAPEEDMERIRQAMRNGAAIVMPSHKSHFDYLLLAWVFYRHNLTLPHVVAGANLAIPGVSYFLRSCGGFFVKRTFAGDKLHPEIFSRYLFELVNHGAPVEFYLEGGRTRTGKLMAPKVGVLGMIFDSAAMSSKKNEVTLLPVALAYEQVAEQRSMMREQAGASKRTESWSELVGATRILKRRLGKVYLRVGEPIPVRPLVDEGPGQRAWSERDRDVKKRDLHRVARTVMHHVGLRTVILPTTLVALALLAHHRRGIHQAELIERIRRFYGYFERREVPAAASLARFDEAIRLALARLAEQRAIEQFELEGRRIWAVCVDHRVQLDFTKNQGMHVFALACMVTAAVRSVGDVFTLQELRQPFCTLKALWQREFILHPDWSVDKLIDEGLQDLVCGGAVRQTESGWAVASAARMGEIHGLIRPLLEGYSMVLARCVESAGALSSRKELVRRLQQDADKLLAAGVISRPEALSLTTLDNAFKQLESDGLIVRDGADRLTSDRSGCEALLNQVKRMVAG